MGAGNNHVFKKQGNTEEIIKTILNSKTRTKILRSLTREPMRLSDISNSVGCERQNTLPELKKLRELHLVVKDDKIKTYALTVYGEIIKDRISDFIMGLDNLDGYALILNQFNDLPDSFIREFESLINSRKLKNDEINLFNNRDIFNSGEDLKLIMPIFNSNLLNSLSKRTSNGLNTEIILTPAIIRYISQLNGGGIFQTRKSFNKFTEYQDNENGKRS